MNLLASTEPGRCLHTKAKADLWLSASGGIHEPSLLHQAEWNEPQGKCVTHEGRVARTSDEPSQKPIGIQLFSPVAVKRRIPSVKISNLAGMRRRKGCHSMKN